MWLPASRREQKTLVLEKHAGLIEIAVRGTETFGVRATASVLRKLVATMAESLAVALAFASLLPLSCASSLLRLILLVVLTIFEADLPTSYF